MPFVVCKLWMYNNKETNYRAASHDQMNATAQKQRKPQILEELGREGSRRTLGARSPESTVHLDGQLAPCRRVAAHAGETGRRWRSKGASPGPHRTQVRNDGALAAVLGAGGARRGLAGGLSGTEQRERRGPEGCW